MSYLNEIDIARPQNEKQGIQDLVERKRVKIGVLELIASVFSSGILSEDQVQKIIRGHEDDLNLLLKSSSS